MKSTRQQDLRNWLMLGLVCILAAYACLLLEWAFFVTKASFFSAAAGGDQIFGLLVPPLVPATFSVFVVLCLWLLSRGCSRFLSSSMFFAVACLVPALLLACTMLLAVDNFSYTVFQFGVIKSRGVYRYLYALLFLGFMLYVASRLFTYRRNAVTESSFRRHLYGTLCLVLVSFFASVGAYYTRGETRGIADLVRRETKSRLPNIIIFSSDGLDATHLSAYGYGRKTTPYLQRFMKDSWYAENAFTNCGNTGCSMASLFTGRLPTETKLVYPPDILRGEMSYQHLPGILRRLGYRSADISTRHYADAFDLNLRDSFHYANSRKVTKYDFSFLPAALVRRFGLEGYFLAQVAQRLELRLLHSFGVRRMVDAFKEVTQAERVAMNDRNRVRTAIRFIKESTEPFFVHVHLLGTHGPRKSSK